MNEPVDDMTKLVDELQNAFRSDGHVLRVTEELVNIATNARNFIKRQRQYP